MAALNDSSFTEEQAETINELECAKCHEIFHSRPAVLECKNVICDVHLYKYEAENQANTFVCTLCKGTHSLDVARDDELDKRVMTHKYQNIINEMRERLNEYEEVKSNPSQYISNYFADLRQQIVNRKAEVETIVNNHYIKFVEQLEAERENLKRDVAKKKNVYAEEVASLKTFANELTIFRDYLTKNPNSYITHVFGEKLKLLERNLDEKIKRIKHNLIGDKIHYITQGDENVAYEEIFGRITSLPFTAYKVISGDKSGSIKIWHLDEEKCVRTIDAHDTNIRALKMVGDPDKPRNTLISYGEDSTIMAWDLDETRPKASFNFKEEKKVISSYLGIVKYEEQVVISSCNNTIYLIEFKGNDIKNTIHEITNHHVSCLKNITDIYTNIARRHSLPHEIKNVVITGSSDSNIYIWDLNRPEEETNKIKWISEETRKQGGWGVACFEVLINQSNDHYYISCLITGHENGFVLIHELSKNDEDGSYKRNFTDDLCVPEKGSGIQIVYLKLIPNNTHVICVRLNGEVKKLSLLEKKCVLTFNVGKTTSILLMSDYELAVAGEDNLIRVYSLLSDENGKVLKTLRGHTGRINVLKMPAENQLISASDDHTIKFWNVEFETCRRTLNGHLDGVTCLEIFKDENLAKDTPVAANL